MVPVNSDKQDIIEPKKKMRIGDDNQMTRGVVHGNGFKSSSAVDSVGGR